MSRYRTSIAVVAIALLFLVVAYLLSKTATDATTVVDAGVETAREAIVFPRERRVARRSTLRESQLAPEQQQAITDQLERALAAPGARGAMVVEVNAIRHTPLVEKILQCREGELLSGMNEMKERLGIDPLEDLDRVGVMEDVVVASGFFEQLKVPEALGAGEPYAGGKIWREGEGDEAVFLGQVGGGLLMTAKSEAGLKAAMDRATSTAPATGPGLFAGEKDGAARGEMYGRIGGDLLGALLQSSGNPQAQQFAEVISNANMQMNVDEHVAASLDVSGTSPEKARDLQKALTAALALGRAEAERTGESELAWLLDQARVNDGNAEDTFELDIAVPGEVVLKAMGCDQNGRPLQPPTPQK